MSQLLDCEEFTVDTSFGLRIHRIKIAYKSVISRFGITNMGEVDQRSKPMELKGILHYEGLQGAGGREKGEGRGEKRRRRGREKAERGEGEGRKRRGERREKGGRKGEERGEGEKRKGGGKGV